MGSTPESGHETQGIESWLLDAGLVDEEAMSEAKHRSAETGERLIDALFATGALSPRDVKELLKSSTEPARIECAQIDIRPEVLELIPKALALKFEIVPLDRMGKVLTVAAKSALNSDTLRPVEEATGLAIKPIVCAEEDVDAALKRYYGEIAPTEDDLDSLEGPVKLNAAMALVRGIDGLPALPGTVQRVREMVYEKDGSSAQVAEIVGRDPATVARILQVANSAAYGLPRKVDSIDLAVALLGLEETFSLVLAMTALNLFDRSRSFDYMTFWIESMVCASIANSIAKQVDKLDITGVFSAALLHDLGRVALAQIAPKHYASLDTKLLDYDLIWAEQEHLGLDHTEAGFQLAQKWALPASIADTMRFHHAPRAAGEDSRAVVSVVHIADLVSRSHRPDSATREVDLAPCREALDYLGLNQDTVTKVFSEVAESGPPPVLWSKN